MITVGVLLPGSTLYPSISIDFLQGIKSCLSFYEYKNVDIQVNTISYGIKGDEIYAAAEKLLLVNNAEVVIVFAEDYHAEKLSPLFVAAGKLLILTNAGANYPISFSSVTHTIFHSLNDCLCTFLTGKYAARKEGGHGAILATSFFDGGYKHTHAITNAFILSGGEIEHNFVSHYKKEEFNTDSLTAFIKSNPEVKKILAVFCGDMARYFYEKMNAIQQESKLEWFGSPMMFDCTPGDFAEQRPAVPNISGYTNWVPELDNEANRSFRQYCKNEIGKEANIFSMQGWEIGLLLMEFLTQRKAAANTELAIEQLKGIKINSPRGAIKLNNKRFVLGPPHLVKATGKLEITVEESIKNAEDVWEEMIAQIPLEEFSAWRNTYLCI